MMQVITIAGNIGKDAELRRTQDGTPVAGFSVAVSTGRDQTTWWDVSLWGTRAEKLAQYLTKGSKISVSGTFGTREHEGKTYLQCRANEIALQGGKPQQQEDIGGYGGGHDSGGQGGGRSDLDSEIPFAPEWRI